MGYVCTIAHCKLCTENISGLVKPSLLFLQ